MKKVLAILLVALLAVSSVFALDLKVTGEASVDLAYNLDKSTLGFANKNTPKGSATATLTTGSENEGDWYAVIKGTVKLEAKEGALDGLHNLVLSVDSAVITNDEWTIDIMKAAGVADFAKAFYNGANDKPLSTATAIVTAPGITVSNSAFAVGAGLDMDFSKADAKKDFSASLAVKEIALEGLTIEAAAGVSSKFDMVTAMDNLTNIAAGAKFGFANDTFSASVAADLGVEMKKSAKTTDLNVDVAATFDFSAFTVNAFFALKAANNVTADKTLSAQLVADLNDFEVPVKLTVDGIDLVNKQDLAATAEFALDAVEAKVYGGYAITPKTWKAGASVGYTIENIGKLAANVDVTDSAATLKAGVSLTNTTLVSGATLSVGWASGNLLAKAGTPAKATPELGAITATAKMSF